LALQIDNRFYRHLQWNQPELTTLCPGSPFGVCVGVREELDKEMTMIAALKQHYEYAGDLTALKKLYEYHAENCEGGRANGRYSTA
jgi:hypothetical protein